MSSRVSGLRKILNSLFSDGDDSSKTNFIYFWDDLIEEEIVPVETDKISFIEKVKNNQLTIMTFVTIFFAFMPWFFYTINQPVVSLAITIVLVIVILSTYFVHYNVYQKPLELIHKQSVRFKENNFSLEDEFLFGVSDDPSIENFNEFRKNMYSTIKTFQQNMNELNFQLTMIENSFVKTSTSLGQVNLSFDESLSNIGVYQGMKGYLTLSSTGVDTLTSAFDDSITVIYEVIKILKSLGKQTQMLALNAGIEAARSEEYGDGFEVVASNLRRLSIHVSKSANDVKSQISDISENAKQSIETITSSMHHLSIQLDRVHSVSSSIYNNIGDSSREFNSVQSNYDDLVQILRKLDEQIHTLKI